jgi:hypothetical protein
MEARNFAEEIRVSTLWKNSITCTRTKVKQEDDLCVRKKSFRDDGGLG